ncbi:MAG TPA: hypothetical protein VF432_15780 [Thermoanaerobaculia bacterium]
MRIGLYLAVAASLIAVSARAQESRGPRTRNLVVVIWERRVATETVDRFGTILQTNREALLDLIYGDANGIDRPLVASPADTVLAVYPEGFPAEKTDPALYRDMKRASAAQIRDVWIPQMVVTADSTTGLTRGLYYRATPARKELDHDLQRRITFPIAGRSNAPLDTPESLFDGSRPDPNETRGATCPPLVSYWALHHAASHAGNGPPFGTVHLVWVLAGDKNYKQTIVEERLEFDRGKGTLAFFNAVENLYIRDGDVPRTSLLAARGRIAVFVVTPAYTKRNQPKLRVSPSSFDFTARWHSMPEFLRRWSFFQTLEDLPPVSWSSHVTTPDYRLIPGSWRWENNTFASAMNASGGMTQDIRPAIRRIVEGGAAVNENIVAHALAVPEPQTMREDLRALWFPIATPVQAGARVSVAVRPIEWWVYGLAVLLIGVAVWIALMRRRKRQLYATVDWPDAVDFPLGRAEDTLVIPARLSLQDRSNFRRRRANIDVTLSIRRSVAGFTLLDENALCTVTPESIHLDRPLASGEALPIEVRVHGTAVDLRRIAAGKTLRAGVVLTVSAEDASNRYVSTPIESPFIFDVTIAATDPDYDRLIKTRAISPLYEKGLIHVPGPSRTRVPVGWVRLRNEAAPGRVAREVLAKITRVAAHVDVNGGGPSRPVKAQLVPVGDLDPDRLALKNGEEAAFDVFLTIEPDTLPAGTMVSTVSIHVDAEFRVDGTRAKSRSAEPIVFNWFAFEATRHACIDLGTSAVRLLRDGGPQGPDRWGYVLFGRPPWNEGLNARWPNEDLPSFARFMPDGRTYIGLEALSDQRPPNFKLSVKDVMIENIPGGEGDIEKWTREFFAKYYLRSIAETAVVRNPYSHAEEKIVKGDASVLVASIPNDCSPRYRQTYEKALAGTKRFHHISLLREAEAVSIWYAAWVREQRLSQSARKKPSLVKQSEKSEVVIVDVGAGTTDAALAEITDPAGNRSPIVRIRSIGAASLAGRFIDKVIFAELVRQNWLERESLNRLTELDRLEIAEGVKIAIAEGQPSFRREADTLYGYLDLNAEQLESIKTSTEYRNAIHQIAEASLSVLLGRLPADVPLDHPRTLLLTGRGARMHGLRKAIVDYLERRGMTKIDVAAIPEHLLKASVTIGCRAFAINAWSELQRSSDASVDRILLVYRSDTKAAAIEMLPAGAPLAQPGPWIAMPRWSDAKVIATHLRQDELLTDPALQLNERKIVEILDGRLPARPQWHPLYSLVRASKDLPRSDEYRSVEARVTLRPGGIEFEQRPQSPEEHP